MCHGVCDNTAGGLWVFDPTRLQMISTTSRTDIADAHRNDLKSPESMSGSKVQISCFTQGGRLPPFSSSENPIPGKWLPFKLQAEK